MAEEYAMVVRNLKSSLEERVNLLGNQNKKRSHSDKGMRRKGRVTGNDLDAVIQIISLAIVQNYLATKIKRHSLEVLVGNKSSSRVNTSKDNYSLQEEMEFENTHNNALAKLPMLKLGEYEMWEIRIK
ncbi:hypothetical protein Tco_1110487 [Tanacetum coccineum]|uniref:Uncharacterized protein n=1 Tax=Tanacetum coccineum TaxID=301880 RepID=A0ABQ5ILG2_9ASTR